MEKNYTTILDKEMQELFESFENEIIHSNSLFHYTSQNSLLSILNSSTIWMGNVRSLNDPIEITFGLTVIHEILKRSGRYNEFKYLLIENNFPKIDDLLALYIPTFAFSFTEVSDSLSQWINYGDNGNGICIEFNRNIIFEHFNNCLSGELLKYLYPIVYYDENYQAKDQRIPRFEESIVSFFLSINEKIQSSDTDFELYSILSELNYITIVLASIIKNSFHSDEKEWRYLILSRNANHDHIAVVSHANRLKPVFLLPINVNNRFLDCINGILMGPKNSSSALSRATVQRLVNTYPRQTEMPVENSKGKLNP